MGITYADGVRVGLEDNLWLDKDNKERAKNADLVSRVLRVAQECRRPIAARNVVRESLFNSGTNNGNT